MKMLQRLCLKYYVKKVYLKKNNKIGMPFDSSLNLKKLKKILKIIK